MGGSDVPIGDEQRKFAPCPDDELADTFLRNAKTPCFDLIGNNAVAKLPALNLEPGEKLAPRLLT